MLGNQLFMVAVAPKIKAVLLTLCDRYKPHLWLWGFSEYSSNSLILSLSIFINLLLIHWPLI